MALLVATLLHTLLLVWMPPPPLDFSAEEPKAEPILLDLVDLADLEDVGEMSPDADDASAGREPEQGEQPRTVDDQPLDPSDPVEKTAEGEPEAPPLEPHTSPPGFTLADITVDDPGEASSAPPLDQQRRAVSRPPGAEPSRAPEALCSQDFSLCVFESGDVVEINAALAESLANEAGSGIRVAESAEELQEYRQQFHHEVVADSGPVGMPVYRNYGRLPGKDKVDLERLSTAASGAPYNCRVYPDALMFEPEHPLALYIVIDSSGSMNKNKYTSKATRCAWAAAESALEHDIPVGVINFSDKLYIAEEGTDAQRIAEVICKAQKQETLLPEEQLEEIVTDSGARRDVLLISDGVIQNLDAAVPHLQSVLERNPNNRGIALLIDHWTNGQNTRKALHGIGFRVTLLHF